MKIWAFFVGAFVIIGAKISGIQTELLYLILMIYLAGILAGKE